MRLAVHQPIFLPWPGFFAKALGCDRLVLLDDVQFPRGRTWLTSNRLKNETGELWLRVPVWRTGQGVQTIAEVQVAEEHGWRAKHLRGVRQNYAHAPYLRDYYSELEAIYGHNQPTLRAFNLELIRWLWAAFAPGAQLVLQSDLAVQGQGTELLVRLCEACGADELVLLPGVVKHLDEEPLRRRGIATARLNYRPVSYPQLWGDFVYNLSALDLLLVCGPRSRDVVAAAIA